MPILNWSDCEQTRKAKTAVPFRLLKESQRLSYGDKNSGNVLIQGDNLHALKALLPYYRGQVKCIYIDPPFNTKGAFEYYQDSLQHSQWLHMIFPRLQLLRDLLAEDGTFFAHIDDNELAYLIVILDEVFGRANRISIVSFKQASATGHKAINPGIVNTTNFVLIYSKNKEKWVPNKIFTSREERNKRYGQFIDNYQAPFHEWRLITLASAFAKSLGLSEKGLKKKIGEEEYEEKLSFFVIENAERVIQLARPNYQAVSNDARNIIDKSKTNPNKVFLLPRENHSDMYFIRGERIIFYRDRLRFIDGKYVAGEPLTSLWDDILSNNLHNEGYVDFPKGKKPEALIKRCIELSTKENDLVLDSFLGSGTTAAVAHKMNRRYIGIEMGEHAKTHCAARLKKVVDGEQGGISKAVNWQGGGGFSFYQLGAELFTATGEIHTDVRFAELAAYIWFYETHTPWQGAKEASPLLGVHHDTAYYLLYNGILKDKSEHGGNILTKALLKELPKHKGKKVIYALESYLDNFYLDKRNIQFHPIPQAVPNESEHPQKAGR